jgi:hypothetical protein
MNKTTLELKEIARIGGNLNIDASSRTTLEIKEIARIISNSDSILTLRNAGDKTTLELKEIARIAKSQVTFEL